MRWFAYSSQTKVKPVYSPFPLTISSLFMTDSDKGAAALDVNVGSLEDPFEVNLLFFAKSQPLFEKRAGLAHFLEHMLFMGSEKFPDQAEYSSYLSKNSGKTTLSQFFDLFNALRILQRLDISNRYKLHV